MDGLGSHDAGDVFAVFVAHQDLGAGHTALVPAAQGQEAQGAVGLDGMDHHAHLVGVGVQHDDGAVAGVFLAADIEIAQAVLLQGAEMAGVFTGHSHHFVLKGAGAGSVCQAFEH